MTKYPKDLPKELQGLWRIQYAQREKAILNNVNSDIAKKYKKLNYAGKIKVIDNIQARGFFQ